MGVTRKDRNAALHHDRSWFLLSGFFLDMPTKPFKDAEEIRKAWKLHRQELMERGGPGGKKPWGHYYCDKGIGQLRVDRETGLLDGMQTWIQLEKLEGKDGNTN